jgi:hypothetical protein
MHKIILKVRKPDDSREYYPSVTVKMERLEFSRREVYDIDFNRNAKDPIHSSLTRWWRSALSTRRGRGTTHAPNLAFSNGVPFLLYIGELPIAITKTGSRYQLNGKTESANTIANALARVTVTAMRENSPTKLMSALMKVLSLSEDVKYVLENRVPFHYFIDFYKVEVRLKVQQISEKECAIEISDGVWAAIKNTELNSFCTFFLHGKKSGKFKYMGIKRLYTYLMGKEPTDSQLELMRQFLRQNRQQDIVEDRAIQLLHEMVTQQPERLELTMDGKQPKTLLIKGNGYDWKLSNTEFKSDIQMVSTYVLQPNLETNEEGVPKAYEDCQWEWKGPICIDNMSRGSSLGDQFATRALALINDTHTIEIVNTIKRYLIAPANTNRKDFNEMHRMSNQ